jgi:hypothetical protein
MSEQEPKAPVPPQERHEAMRKLIELWEQQEDFLCDPSPLP